MTISEQPRLKPFIPMPWDTDEAAIKKLRRLKIELERWNAGIEGFYTPDQGYRGVPAPQAPARADRRRNASPEELAFFNRATNPNASPSRGRPAPPRPQAAAPVRVRTSADYARVRAGASYIDPNGVRRIKPEAR